MSQIKVWVVRSYVVGGDPGSAALGRLGRDDYEGWQLTLYHPKIQMSRSNSLQANIAYPEPLPGVLRLVHNALCRVYPVPLDNRYS